MMNLGRSGRRRINRYVKRLFNQFTVILPMSDTNFVSDIGACDLFIC